MTVYNGTADSDSFNATSAGYGLELNTIYGLGGDDYLTGGYLRDIIYGDAGSDTLIGGDGTDILSGGADNDYLHGQEGSDNLYGNNGDDYLSGGDGADTIDTGNGTDTVYAGTGDDTVYLFGEGLKTAYGGAGDDSFFAYIGTDAIYGDQGVDLVNYSYANAGVTINLQGGRGAGDIAEGDTYRSIEDIIGSFYNDRLNGNGAYNTISGGNGNDVIMGGAGGDELDGGADVDTLSYSTSSAAVNVDLQTGIASGGHADGDSFFNFEDIAGSAFNDALYGDAGANLIQGQGGNDSLYGRDGADRLYGLAGADALDGGAGDDTLSGGDDNDALYGNTGRDLLYGGAGADRFVFKNAADTGVSGALQDVIMDFVAAQGDKIDVSGIDANTSASGNQAFSFIGTAAFHGISGELRYQISGTSTYVYGDVNGDKAIDFAIRVNDDIALTSGNFIL
ncbi:calcium-binding protein [Pararhizobium sp. LjRoot238]|uniref:calcium-binding protein n=1 Tax=Pararhizobium sp. LjRoot238 TaxID=3342293 RepID=UPI003ED13C16